MELKRNFSKNVKALRSSRNSSLEEFSDEIGIGKTTLQEIESGKCNSTLDTIETIACRLKLSPLVLLNDPHTPDKFAFSLAVLHMSEIFCRLSKEEQVEAATHFESFIKIMTEAGT